MLGTWIIFWDSNCDTFFFKPPKAYDKTCDFSRRFLSKWVRSSRGRIRKKKFANFASDVRCRMSKPGGGKPHWLDKRLVELWLWCFTDDELYKAMIFVDTWLN